MIYEDAVNVLKIRESKYHIKYDLMLMVSSIIGQFNMTRDEVLNLTQRDFEDKLSALDSDSAFMTIMRARNSTPEEKKNYPPELINDINEFNLFKEEMVSEVVRMDYINNRVNSILFRTMLGDIKRGRPDGNPIRYSIYEAYNYLLKNGGVLDE